MHGCWACRCRFCQSCSLPAVGPDQERQARADRRLRRWKASSTTRRCQRAQMFLAQTPDRARDRRSARICAAGVEQKRAASEPEGTPTSVRPHAYTEALAHQPSPKLEAYIHTSLANVAYFQDDFRPPPGNGRARTTSWKTRTIKSWVLYRMASASSAWGNYGGRQDFAAVEDRLCRYAPRPAGEGKAGARGFSVQFATFLNAATADAAIGRLRREGVPATSRPDANGRSVVIAGPVPTYQQAQALKRDMSSSIRMRSFFREGRVDEEIS